MSIRSELFAAASDGNVEQMKKIIDGRSDYQERRKLINTFEPKRLSFKTILHIAAEKGHCDMIGWILSDKGGRAAGFNSVLAKIKNNKMKALHLAARRGNLEACQAIVKGCTWYERDEMLNAVAQGGWTVLHTAASYGHSSIVSWLLSNEEGGGRAAGFNSVLARSSTAITALHEAVWNGHIEACRAIVNGCTQDEREEMLNAVKGDQWTVLHIAAANGYYSIISWLLSNEEGGGRAAGFNQVLARTSANSTALHLVERRGKRNLEACQAIVKGCTQEEREEMLNAAVSQMTVLHIAASKGHSPVISWLLSNEEGGGRAAGFKSVLARNNEEKTALHLAARKGHFEACRAIVNGCTQEEREEMLNAVQLHNRSLLHDAAAMGYSSIISWLLSNEEGGGRAAGFKNVLARCSDEKTALHAAVEHWDRNACRALLDGCTEEERQQLLTAVDERGSTALHEACREGKLQLCQMMLNVCSEEHRETLLNAKSRDGVTMLHLAAATKYANHSIFRWLLSEEGGGFSLGFRYDNLFSSNASGDTPLHIAAKMRSVECIETLVSCCRNTADRLRLLRAVNKKNGWTVIHTATWANRVELISHLLHRYPELQMIVNTRDNRGMTALHLAVSEDQRWFADAIPIVAALLGMNIQGRMLEGQQVRADPNIGCAPI